MVTLNRIEAWLIKYPNVSISVAGNTDDTANDVGGPDVSKLDNFLMGNMRAQAVANYLMEQYSPYGVIAPSRVNVTSYGQGCPIAKGNDQNSLRQNRNVIISVQGASPQNCNAEDWSDIDNFTVIFGDGGFKLTPRIKKIIDENAKGNADYTYIVSGYTDTVGTPEDNQALSQSRADAVADQLVADGVPKSNIYVNAYGEKNLLVSTGPGVREPQNNRVTVEAGMIWSPGPGFETIPDNKQ
jgi:outer membrane protein OmpA-like peptidoglycan-associated protein